MSRNRLVAGIIAGACIAMLLQLGCRRAPTNTTRMHTRSSFDLVVKAPYETVGPLFGADGERAWAGSDWNPQFIYPAPARDIPGAVFTVSHLPVRKSLWITPTFDLVNRHIQYVYVIPDTMITLLDITFPPSDPSETHVHVVYERTALAEDADQHVSALAAHQSQSAAQWQKELDAYVEASRKKPR